MGKQMLNDLDPTRQVLDVGTCAHYGGRKHITQGGVALCGTHLHIVKHGLRNRDWDGVPNCERCLNIANFVLATQTLVRAELANPTPMDRSLFPAYT